jgi:hypothetical protein
MSTLEELEVRIAALEKKVGEDLNFLIKSFEDDQDDLIRRIDFGRSEAAGIAEHARARAEKFSSEMQELVGARLQDNVPSLIVRSNYEVVINALREALANTILKTRPASREELKSGDGVLVVRQATVAELRGQ